MQRFRLISISAGLLLLLTAVVSTTLAKTPKFEYRVVVVQGLTAGGTLERQENGAFLDTRRTSIMNELAAENWELVTVLGATATDHTLYLRRDSSR